MSRKYTKMESLAEDILCMKQKGMTYREIGESFGLSREQVKTYSIGNAANSVC